MWANTSTGDRTCKGKSTGAITGNCWKQQYSGTVEGIFRANTQVVVKEQGFMRVSSQVKVGIGTNPPVNKD